MPQRNVRHLMRVYVLVFGLLATATALGPPFNALGVGIGGQKKCEPSVTTSSGKHAIRQGPYCSGDLIFEDTFDTFDLTKWQHESTLSGGGNWEFQWYTNNRSNSFCEEGFLHMRPTLTSDVTGESFLSSGFLSIYGGSPADTCTDPSFWGCERTGSPANVLNSVRSARLRTVESFSFMYGKAEINAKMPTGDWLWPAIWFLPRDNAYGSWPSSGEIDLVELRGNRDLSQNGLPIGNELFGSTLHFGPYPSSDPWQTAHFDQRSVPGNPWSNDLHRYQMEWTPVKITFSVDDVEFGTVSVENGFWNRGGFDASSPNTDNPWRLGTPMAPFDQEFYIVMNLAVGGICFFPDDAVNNGAPKPWMNTSPTAGADFWNAKNSWLSTWNLDQDLSRDASLIVDYVRIWAL